MIAIEEPPDGWPLPFWAELAGIATIGFACGLLVGYVRAPRAQRKVVNQYLMERISDRTRTVVAILKVSAGYWDDEIEGELLCPGDVVQEAIVISAPGEEPNRHGETLPYHPAAY